MYLLRQVVFNQQYLIQFRDSSIFPTTCISFRRLTMEGKCKREHEDDTAETKSEQPNVKCLKTPSDDVNTRFSHILFNKNRPVPRGVIEKLSSDDIKLLEEVKTSCTDLNLIKDAIKLRIKHRLSPKLPEDLHDSEYYIEDGLRRVYPYQYLFQAHAKRRWLGRKLKDVLKQEFRDITDEQLKWRFDKDKVLVNGEPLRNYEYVLRDNDVIANRTHRHELPVLATPIRIIHQDKEMLVVNKPPSMPIHPCGRYRHNSVIHILEREYKFKNIKVCHRLDRLVSGVLLIALNSGRANFLENQIKNRNVQKEYVCRVVGEFPLGDPENDGEITVEQPLDSIPGKIGITVVMPEGKPSLTKFKRLNYNGKTSAVICKPLTGRMHQIRVHLQYLGHPIVNDALYNCSAFGPERGKGGKFGKSLQKLSEDIIAMHRASTWLITEDNDMIDPPEMQETSCTATKDDESQKSKVVKFVSEEEREETMAALENFFTDESWKELEQKLKFDESKYIMDPECRDCSDRFYDPPLRSLFLYLHALRYSGDGWCYESELPAWARESWKY